jgi:peptidoglycan hydrolase-like protein with peptidoglycan-binding domain
MDSAAFCRCQTREKTRRKQCEEVTVRTLIRKLVVGTASVIALGIAGDIASNALDYAADVGGTATAASMQAGAQTSQSVLTGDAFRAFRTDDIRWAQVELHDRQLYNGSLDGILGPETKRALSRFQKLNGLGQTASLDARTWEALTGNSAIGEGSTTPDAAASTPSSAAGGLGK